MNDDYDPEKERLFQIQRDMQPRTDTTPHMENYRYVGGADLTDRDGLIVGCFVVIDCQDNFKVVYQKCTEMKVDFKYKAGLLCFREGPVVIALYREFCQKCPDIKLDVILCDGSGEWHMRGVGLSSYVGVELQVPAFGVFKKFLKIGPELDENNVLQEAHQKCKNIGDYIILEHEIKNGTKVRCAVMKTMDGPYFDPIYVTPGHLIDLQSSIEITKRLCRYREPEPLRLADRISRKYIDDKNNRFHYRPS
ncbi:hypothetical protein M9Y10_016204 [Tritrichomonas musculus]|uniref:Endonuclease V n=1 Tax=Tritrichomonas musculus TaxID=1915356 RepID=A0ABR2I6C8_9EUKA